MSEAGCWSLGGLGWSARHARCVRWVKGSLHASAGSTWKWARVLRTWALRCLLLAITWVVVWLVVALIRVVGRHAVHLLMLLLRIEVVRVSWVLHLMIRAHVALLHVGLRRHRRRAASRSGTVEWRTGSLALLKSWRHVGPTRLVVHVAEARTRRAHELLALLISSSAAASLRLEVLPVHIWVHALVADLALHGLRRSSALVHGQVSHGA